MYEYFGVGSEIQEKVAGFFPRFLRWLPKRRLSTPSRRSLEIWHLMIDNLTADDLSPFPLLFFNLWYLVMAWSFLIIGSFVIFQMSLNPWVGCEGYVECEQASEMNGLQVLFECRHGRYWYLGDRVLPHVQHKYPPTTIPIPPCPSIRLVDFLADEEIDLKGIILNSFELICKAAWLA